MKNTTVPGIGLSVPHGSSVNSRAEHSRGEVEEIMRIAKGLLRELDRPHAKGSTEVSLAAQNFERSP